MKLLPSIFATALALCASSQGAMVITEWMYDGIDGEFIEFTNNGGAPVDMATWSFDDLDGISGTVSLAGFGIVQPGQSVILTDLEASAFRLAWGLSASVGVIGGNVNNLGRGDTINLFNGTTLVDQLIYGDNVAGVGGPRTQGTSGVTTPNNYGAAPVTTWFLSTNGVNGAVTSLNGNIASPGFAPVPEPSAAILSALAGLSLVVRRRR